MPGVDYYDPVSRKSARLHAARAVPLHGRSLRFVRRSPCRQAQRIAMTDHQATLLSGPLRRNAELLLGHGEDLSVQSNCQRGWPSRIRSLNRPWTQGSGPGGATPKPPARQQSVGIGTLRDGGARLGREPRGASSMAEQRTFNPWVQGSSPWRPTQSELGVCQVWPPCRMWPGRSPGCSSAASGRSVLPALPAASGVSGSVKSV